MSFLQVDMSEGDLTLSRIPSTKGFAFINRRLHFCDILVDLSKDFAQRAFQAVCINYPDAHLALLFPYPGRIVMAMTVFVYDHRFIAEGLEINVLNDVLFNDEGNGLGDILIRVHGHGHQSLAEEF